MSDALLALEQLDEELKRVKALPLVPWHSASRGMLVSRLEEWRAHTRQAKELLKLLQLEQLKNPELKGISLQEVEKTLTQNETILTRNIAFEEDKKSRKIDLGEKLHVPELGTDLENKIHRQWLSLHRVREQVTIQLRRADGMETGAKELEERLFGMLKTKEEELNVLKRERDQLKRDKFFGANEGRSLTEMENELQELLQQFAVEKHAVFDQLEQSKKKLDEFSLHHAHVGERTKKLEHLVHELTKRHVDVLSSLKKERDFARKLALDLETETAQLRALYSKELLTLEEKKHALRKEAEDTFRRQITELQQKSQRQEANLREMDSLVREKERQLQRMAEKVPTEENTIPQPFTINEKKRLRNRNSQ